MSRLISVKAHNWSVKNLILFNETKLIISNNIWDVKIWNSKTFECLKVLENIWNAIISDITPNGNLVCYIAPKEIKIWQIESVKLLKSIELEEEKDVSFIKTLKKDILAIGHNGYISIFDLTKMEKVTTIKANLNQYIHILSNGVV